jgi:hypothetical protein
LKAGLNKPTLIVGGIVVILLASAAYVSGRLLTGQGLAWLSQSGQGVSLDGGNSNGVHIDRGDVRPAKELPQAPADIDGIFDYRQDNSIFVGTGNFNVRVQADQSGKVETGSHYDGPLVEVVVTSQTAVYEDVTMQQFNGPPADGQKIQQVLESGSLDDMVESSGITVWGKRTGDRIIADVLVYLSPVFKRK